LTFWRSLSHGAYSVAKRDVERRSRPKGADATKEAASKRACFDEKEYFMLGLNVTCIVFGVVGFLCVVACAARELTNASRARREARRRYIKD